MAQSPTFRRYLRFAEERAKKNPRVSIPLPTESECVKSTFYDIESGTLLIEFVERGTYEYYDVPIHIWDEFNNAGSRGTYFNLYIRNEGYSYLKVG